MKEVPLLSRGGVAAGGASGNRTQRYWAFLSYSHMDSDTADWLHGALEKYRVPRALVGKETATGPIPSYFAPIFRDRHELAASGDLGHTIREALAASRCLIVLCSPEAARSRWTNEEILAFKKLRPDGLVLAAITGGEPFASEIPGREGEECFPPALRQKYDRRGRPTGKRAEPIAADLRADKDGRQLGMLKLVAGMLGVGLDDLVQREQQRKQRRLTYIAAASLAGMTLTSGLAVFAFDKRDEARDQRREAEGLVGFMLGDLREKLEPIKRLDALDAVGARALEYFAKQDKSELSDEALLQRSRALTLMGEIAQTRGDLGGALARYREAMAGTAEMVRRGPDVPQRLFDHAQNVFWVGEIARQRGRTGTAEAAAREYKRLAERMIAIDPNDSKWQMETRYADANLGIVLFTTRKYPEATSQFRRALDTIERLAASEPANGEYQKAIAESLAWLADALRADGKLDEAIAQRERQIALLARLGGPANSDVEFRQKLIPAREALGRLFASKGDHRLAIEQLRSAVELADQLIPVGPDNSVWQEFGASAKLALANELLAMRRNDEAAAQARAGCDLANRLAAKDRSVADWRDLARRCFESRARVALASGKVAEALDLANRALDASRSRRSGDPIEDRYTVGSIHRLVGEIHARGGNRVAATTSWQAGLSVLPGDVRVQPWEMRQRAALLMRLGRSDEARGIEQRLASMGYDSKL